MTTRPPLPDRVVLASGNAGKLAELAELFAPFAVELLPQSHFGIHGPEETGATFVENAILKARHAARGAGLPALADDSGLCVDALGGAPGVRSARFAGPGADDGANNALLLERLAGLPAAARGATFHCTLVFLRSADDPDPLIASGRWRGAIATEPQGEGGFGYDPLFVDPGTQRRAAELDPGEKHRRGHRGRAAAALGAQLEALLHRPPS